jgi:TfoX/Sxy family transcriptional regulator of competence genes
MAWIKVPVEHHPLFRAALPADPRVTTLNMFGGIAAKANGNMFSGLFGRSAIVRLSDAHRAEALALDGAGPFDPMGNGRVSAHTIMLPEDVMHDPDDLKSWLRRAFDHALSLPANGKGPPKPAAKKPATKKPAKPAAARHAKKR